MPPIPLLLLVVVGGGMLLAMAGAGGPSAGPEPARESPPRTPRADAPPQGTMPPRGTGNVGTLLSVAASYVGVTEVPPKSNRGPEVDRFNLEASAPLGSMWCASFVSYVILRAGVGTRPITSVQTIYNRAKNLGVWSSTPSVGAVFLQITGVHGLDGVDAGHNHTGLVTAVNPDGSVQTIEGNASSMVRREVHPNAQGAASEINAGYVPFEALGQVFS